jgi:hypothetical protein
MGKGESSFFLRAELDVDLVFLAAISDLGL